MENNITYMKSSSRRSTTFPGLIRSFSEHPYSRFASEHEPRSSSTSSTSSLSKMERFLKKMRRKLIGEKKAFGSGRHSNPVIVPYNSYTYAMNFDEPGSTTPEPDNIPRSFSARFAGAASSSSRMFMKRVQSVR